MVPLLQWHIRARVVDARPPRIPLRLLRIDLHEHSRRHDAEDAVVVTWHEHLLVHHSSIALVGVRIRLRQRCGCWCGRRCLCGRTQRSCGADEERERRTAQRDHLAPRKGRHTRIRARRRRQRSALNLINAPAEPPTPLAPPAAAIPHRAWRRASLPRPRKHATPRHGPASLKSVRRRCP